MLTDESVLLDNLEEEEENPPLIQWMQDYAVYAGPKTLRPTLEEIHEAINQDFPELKKSDLDLDHLLEELGIHVIVDLQDYTVAWFGTTDETIVEDLCAKFKQAPYSQIRRKLGIDYLWILNLRPHLGHMRNDIFEADVEFSELKDKPECAIIDL